MKTPLLLTSFLAFSCIAFCNPASLTKATSEFRGLFESVMSADSSNQARREELRLKLEVEAIYRSEALLGILWIQARRRRAEPAKVEEHRQSSLACLNGIETGVRFLAEAADRTKLLLPKEAIGQSATEVLRLAKIYRAELAVERFPAEETSSNR
jgi:hypothetical protein